MGVVQTQLMLCVADSSPAMFKNFAACKLDADSSNDYGEDSLQLWGAVTVTHLLSHPSSHPHLLSATQKRMQQAMAPIFIGTWRGEFVRCMLGSARAQRYLFWASTPWS